MALARCRRASENLFSTSLMASSLQGGFRLIFLIPYFGICP